MTDQARATLVATLREVVAHLRAHDEPSWADEVDQCRWRIEDGEEQGATRLMRSIDGSGGLTDLDLRVANKGSADPETQEANERLRSLLDDARKLVATL
jgi:hypothetical protein